MVVDREKNFNCINDQYDNSKEVSVTLSENGNPKEISAKLIEKCKSLTKYSNTWYLNKCDELNSK